MAVDIASFRARFPEFAEPTAPTDGLVTAALAAADAQTSDYFEGALRDTLVGLRAARELALTPQGRDSRLTQTGPRTLYDDRIDAIVVVNGVRNRSFGGC